MKIRIAIVTEDGRVFINDEDDGAHDAAKLAASLPSNLWNAIIADEVKHLLNRYDLYDE